MKKLFFIACVWMSGVAAAQTIEFLDVTIYNDQTASAASSANRSAVCGPDTVLYTTAKATGYSALNINNATSAQAAAQYFNAPQPITISGADFYAYKIDATGGITTNVTVAIYAAGIDSMPTGTALATALVSVDTTFGGGNLNVLEKTATFTPVTVTGPYVILFGNYSANGVGLIFNDYNTADGANEWLCGIDISGSWYRPYNVNVGGVPFNADMIVHPHVSYELNANFTTSDPCMASGPTINFTNTSSPVFEDRMYNQLAFLSLTDLSYTWDFGDGSPTVNQTDPVHAYASVGTYSVTLTDSIFGWTTSCTADTTKAFGETVAAGFSNTVNGYSVNFLDQSTATAGVTNRIWNFGDGNTSAFTNPSHTYAANGNYLVCLTITGTCGTVDSSCAYVNITECPQPVAGFTVSGTEPTFLFTNTSTTTGTASYNWSFGDGTNSTDTDPSHTYGANGSFVVTLVVTDSCGAHTFTDTVEVTTVGMGELNAEGFGVYPNPASSVLTIQSDKTLFSATLFTMDGKQIYANSSYTDVMTISTAHFSNGVYLLHIHSQDGRELTTRVTVQH